MDKTTKSMATTDVPGVRPRRRDVADFGVLPELLGYQLRRAQVRLFQHFAEHLRDYDITPGQLGLLILISRNPGISQTALARAAGIERSTLGEVVGRLEKRGLVTRGQMPDDRRSYALRLSRKGTRTLNRMLPDVHAHERDFTACLSESERQTLLALLRRLTGT